MRIGVVITLLLSPGCAMTGQAYTAATWNEDGSVRIEQGKNSTLAPPFGSEAVSDHRLETLEEVKGDKLLIMGSKGNVEGGDLSEVLNALTETLKQLQPTVATLEALLEDRSTE